MGKEKVWLPQDIYKMKATLLGTRPPIWRRLLVPAGLERLAITDHGRSVFLRTPIEGF